MCFCLFVFWGFFYVGCVFSLFVSHLFFRCLGKAVIRDCGMFFVLFFFFLSKTNSFAPHRTIYYFSFGEELFSEED